MKAFKVYPKGRPLEMVLVYVRDVNYMAARSWAVANHWAWQPKDFPNLVTELAPRWETQKPKKRFCIYGEDLNEGLPPWGELTGKVKVEVPATRKAWKVYHNECREETLLVYAGNQFQACDIAIGDNPYAWARADLQLLRAYRVPEWDHADPPNEVVTDNVHLHKDLSDFFTDVDQEPLQAHIHKRSNTT